MDWVNPVEWVAWLYGKLFQNHANVGGCVVVALFATIGLVLWIRGVDKYKEEHPPTPPIVEAAIQDKKTDQPATGEDTSKKNNKESDSTHAKSKSEPAIPPRGEVVQPGSVVSIGQQGGITAGQVIVADGTAIPPKISVSQDKVTPPRPSEFPYAYRITITTDKTIDSPNLAMVFDGPVEIPKLLSTSMSHGEARIADTQGKNDPNTAWVFWSSPSITHETPAIFLVESTQPVRLKNVSKGPKRPF
jgi:hypothetical protein